MGRVLGLLDTGGGVGAWWLGIRSGATRPNRFKEWRSENETWKTLLRNSGRSFSRKVAKWGLGNLGILPVFSAS